MPRRQLRVILPTQKEANDVQGGHSKLVADLPRKGRTEWVW